MKARSKLLLSSAALVGALAVATTSTFAWFSTSATPAVDAFELQVQASQGLQVSIDKDPTTSLDWTPYGSIITEADVMEAIQNAGLGSVTSTDGINFKSDLAGTVEAVANTTGTTSSYVSFDLKFKSDKAVDLKLNTNSDVTSAGGQAISSNVAGDAARFGSAVTVGQSLSPKAEDAMRVSFVVGTNVVVWAPTHAANNKSASGFVNDGFTLSEAGADATKNYAYAYYLADLKTGAATAPAADWMNINGTIFGKQTVPSAKIANLIAGETVVKVNMWLDGWDADCFNGILDQKITAILNFIGTASAAP